jgi:hypothetical protein
MSHFPMSAGIAAAFSGAAVLCCMTGQPLLASVSAGGATFYSLFSIYTVAKEVSDRHLALRHLTQRPNTPPTLDRDSPRP